MPERTRQGGKHIPQRRCVGCGAVKDKRELIRVLRTKEGAILIDRTGRRNGRGAYLCGNAGCLKKAVRNHGLERSLSHPIPEETRAELERQLVEGAD